MTKVNLNVLRAIIKQRRWLLDQQEKAVNIIEEWVKEEECDPLPTDIKKTTDEISPDTTRDSPQADAGTETLGSLPPPARSPNEGEGT